MSVIPLKCRYCGAPLPEPTPLETETPHPANLNAYIICKYCGMKYLVTQDGQMEERNLPAIQDEDSSGSTTQLLRKKSRIGLVLMAMGLFLLLVSVLFVPPLFHPRSGPIQSSACSYYIFSGETTSGTAYYAQNCDTGAICVSSGVGATVSHATVPSNSTQTKAHQVQGTLILSLNQTNINICSDNSPKPLISQSWSVPSS